MQKSLWKNIFAASWFQTCIEVCFILLLSLIPLLWLKNDQIVLGHDSGFRTSMSEYYHDLFYSWNPTMGLGQDWSINKGFLVTQIPEVSFSILFGSLSMGQRAAFVFWFAAIGLAMYTALRYFFKQTEAWILRLFGSTSYMLNFFLLQGWFITERAKFSLFAALPLGFLLLYKTLDGKKDLLKNSILFGLTFFFFNGGGSPPLFGSILMVYTTTFLFLTARNVLENGWQELLHSLKVAVSFLFFVVLLNAFWLMPLVTLIAGQYSEAISTFSYGNVENIFVWEKVVSQYASFVHLFRLQGVPEWYNNYLHMYAKYFISYPLLITLSFVPVSMILFMASRLKKFALPKKENQLIYLFLTLLCVSLFFTAGSHPPLGELYKFLLVHVPGFTLFRSAFYKFGSGLWFSMSFLMSFSLYHILLRVKKKKWLYRTLASLSLLMLVMYHFPYFSSDFFDFNVPFTTKITLPEHVTQASDYFEKQSKTAYRTLLVPPHASDLQVDSYNWGFWSFDTLPLVTAQRSFISNTPYAPPVVDELYTAVEQNDSDHFTALTQMLNINQLLWRGDVLYTDKDVDSSKLTFMKNNVSSFHEVTLDKTFNAWEVYSIPVASESSLFKVANSVVFSNSVEIPVVDLLSPTTTMIQLPIVYGNTLSESQKESITPFTSE
jgi:hypothetical protein